MSKNKKTLNYNYICDPEEMRTDANVYVIDRSRKKEISFMDYMKMGFGLYIGFTLASKLTPVLTDKLKNVKEVK
ncbi:MAG: hypothetical protein IKL08_03085 [Clostridia bacterium]|nr:hypothetical protein [Clostridia bacterium]